ncbi:hydrogenase/sulfur reductase subunit alpha [candidate division WOR-1 bacterium RIFCSPHIGHO2_01_FULL_53_15]|uniref:Hydrogenase/sulfur reductase subunit alpha n=1 Tax=candidate division WOR-1 bacterium RIFCSPHIGHO2_01_FULL_53_15 TaxID=1802564 RepID=A0A1F4Q1N6_UNCSA|nr:MAG: hydrogenase/sulfur reductase subunit alpha [candidate division WOR-1 bacterium RIFCSPHIGHO2_01_FULL_53_15]OGC13072.1 MAG: hydrogenase/sulfur reductase subunit alpha [candidate division WOR-1 bacterium RIFCSPHIGHO2_02_FULL_53_26]
MSKDININVHHVARVEGHGNIVIDVQSGELKKVELQIVESPRFFEAMLRGRRFPEAPQITSRICGICAVGHTTASLRALEDALGIEPSEQTLLLRKAVLEAEIMQSHVLHYYFLVAPDFFSVPSVIPLAASHPDVVKRALRMKKLADDIVTIIAGRHPHPISMVVDGFTHIPTEAQLRDALKQLKTMLSDDVPPTLDLFASLKFPAFERKTDYVALKHPDEYAYYDGIIHSTETGETRHRDYKNKVKEEVVLHSTAKQAKGPFRPYMVGALSRFNINSDQLMPAAKAAAQKLGLAAPNYNPYLISAAQVVESVHNIERMIYLIEELLRRGLKDETVERQTIAGWSAKLPPVKKCWGVGAVEVPRGVLFHEYRIDDDGLLSWANCVIPTGQNLANIEDDMRALVPTILDRPQEEITLLLEMLVRAYDPCISCSVHMLKVDFV